MKTITVREMKAHWSEVEAQVRNGETFEVVNRGRPIQPPWLGLAVPVRRGDILSPQF